MGHPSRHSAPVLNSDDHGFDRRYLAAGEVAGDGEGTTMFPTSQRIGWWYYLNKKRLGPSSPPAMAATAVWLSSAGEVRLLAVKWKAWEDSVAHPKLARADGWTGGATKKLVGDQGRDGDVPTSTMAFQCRQWMNGSTNKTYSITATRRRWHHA